MKRIKPPRLIVTVVMASNNEQSLTLKGATLNDSQYSYSAVKVSKTGAKSVNFKNNSTNGKLYVETPLMLTWGVNENEWVEGTKTYDMSLQFPRNGDSNYNESTVGFLKAMQDLEEKVKSDAITNCKEWFSKSKMSAEVIDALWSPMLKYPKNQETGEPDKSREPTLRVKIPVYDGEFRCELYNTSEPPEQVFPDLESGNTPKTLVQKGQNVALVIECGGIWFANGKFGVTWRLVQGVLQPRASIYGKCHINLGSSERKAMREQAEELANEDNNNTVEDSDDENESLKTQVTQEVASEIEEVKPKKTRKVVKKKKESNE